jgi:hypothetical protein
VQAIGSRWRWIMKSRTQHRSYASFVSGLCCAVSLTFNALIADRASASETNAPLDSTDIIKLEPPLTLQVLLARIGDISRKGLIASKDIYTESMLSRLFGAKTIMLSDESVPPRTEIFFFTGEYTIPYANGGLTAQGVKTKFDGRWTRYQYGNTRTTLHFYFGTGGPNRPTLETTLGTQLIEIKKPLLQPPPPHPHGGPPPPTSPDGNKEFRAGTQANPAVGTIWVHFGPDGKLSEIDVIQDDLDRAVK